MINPTLQQKLLDNGYTGEMTKSGLIYEIFGNSFSFDTMRDLRGVVHTDELVNYWLELNKK